MLDKINNNSESIDNLSLNQIEKIGAKNPYESNDKNFFIDESLISNAAYEKYLREIDVKEFSGALFNLDQKSADDLVIKQAFDGILSFDDSYLDELVNNKDFMNEID